MKAVTQGGYSCRVGEDVEECGTISGIARARVGSHYEAQKSHLGRGGELSVVPVARQKHEFWPTIVIILLVSLQDYIVERCQQSGTSYVKLDSRQYHPAGKVVIVAQESAVSKSFGSFSNHLILQRLQQLQWQTKSASTLNTSEISDELLL